MSEETSTSTGTRGKFDEVLKELLTNKSNTYPSQHRSSQERGGNEENPELVCAFPVLRDFRVRTIQTQRLGDYRRWMEVGQKKPLFLF